MSDILDYIDDDFDEVLEDLDDLEEEVETVSGELVEADGDVMSEARARELTEAIRSAATVTYALIAQAHEKKAYKSLGYGTWSEYVKAEFDMSASRSYQLLDLSKVTNEIEAVVPEGTMVKITEAQARDIKRELPQVTEKIREAIEDGEAPDEAVDRVIDEAREQKKAEDKAIENKQKALEDAEEDGYRAGLEAAADAILEQNSEVVNEEGFDVEPNSSASISPEDSMNLYNFFNVLRGVASLPQPDDFVKIIPPDRVDEINEQLSDTQNWLNRFAALWELQSEESNEAVEAIEEDEDEETLY